MKTWFAHALVAILLSSAAQAATTKVAVLPFTGPKATVARSQLTRAVCGELECVPASKASRGNKPDFKKAKRAGVELILTGQVSGPASKRTLTVIAWDANGEQRSKDTFRLARNGKLSRSELDRAAAKVLEVAGATQQQSEPEEEEPLATEREETPPTLLPEASEQEQEQEVASIEREERRDEEAPVALRRRGPQLPLFWVEAGADFTHRSFDYSGLAVANLRAYVTQPALVAPRIQAAVYPLSRSLEGIGAGLGIEGGYAFAVGLRSIDENEKPHPTAVTRLDLGARLDLRPVEGSALMISPQVGYRNATFSVGAADDGSTLAGMPGLTYDALRFGVEAELPIEAMRVFAKASYLQALGLGEIGAAPFFPKSSGSGFEGTLGAGYQVVENVEVRLSLNYTRFGLSFEPEAGATYVATGATDQYLGGALTGRFVY
ncbi:MAG: hypothetical protein WBV82_08405 [Myxococcaceae bacterium]